MATPKPIERTIQYVRQSGIERSRDIEAIGIPREYLPRPEGQGKLSRTERGIYTLPDAAFTEHHSFWLAHGYTAPTRLLQRNIRRFASLLDIAAALT